MKNSVPVSKIMTKKLVTLNTNDDLVTAERLFKKHHIRHIPVVEGKAIKGMLSYTDLLRISFADAVDEHEEYVDTIVYNMFTIPQVMVSDVITVESKTSIRDVARFLSKKEFHALPVVDGGKIVGIVTTTDLINYLLECIDG
ncbi:MAG TPA: CBS domain-containing protein [Muricauda sp.]|uniref:CBS domain-containing protein n=1 Tax=Flagellimonas aurea TaxID=2915619 RepID=A0ABS3G2M7_9FLAO|nr:CBS domain-containing protein [Allomuricauda aurea]MAO15478.1 CBS domain-containing protein [Allomuricauda sp.]UBZ16059.1 CBS domain-containing protein [Allomuricauda aquimarina]MBC72813.1 CBS domain-containing protein [Allomuricauda sp.]MBO0353635.1 CBS domain-containing protein [Allomuricauda aurea]HBU77119.1 CBS domain-containing protein [Allomuricauda sp.]